MIRIIFFFLVTLMLSCSNTRPETTPETDTLQTEVEAPAATTTSAPEAVLPAKETPAEKTIPAQKVVTAKKKAPAAKPAKVSESETTIEADSAAVAAEPVLLDKPAIAAAPAPQPEPAAQRVEAGPQPQVPVWTLIDDKKETRSQRFLPTRRRIDREVNKLKFAYKGEVMCGLTASYGTLTSDDTDFMIILDNIDASGTIATVKPFVGYFYRDNNCVGLRFGYKYVNGKIDNANLDLGESNDISMDIPYVNLKSNNYSFGIFHRSYAGLDPKGRFGLFAEFELALSSGTSEFTYDSGNDRKYTFSDNTKVSLSFNPGAAVYIFPNVCATLSFGLGGIQYTSVTQKDAAGNKTGSRKASNMKFKLNIAAINIGMTIHLWDKKKQ